MIGRKDPIREIEPLKNRVRRIEDDMFILMNERVRAGASSSPGSGAPIVGGGGGFTEAEILDMIQRSLIFQEDISSAGTSHSLTYEPALDIFGNPIILLALNGVTMRRGSSGPNGWSLSGTTVTTVHSLAAADKLTAAYCRAVI